MATINDLYPEVIDALQGRTDVTAAQSATYMKRVLLELGQNMKFEGLSVEGPQVQLTAGTFSYPLANFINAGDVLTSPESFYIFVDYPSNNQKNSLKFRTTTAIEAMTSNNTVGIPAFWNRFGANVYFAPVPNQPYTVGLRYQRQHPFSNTLQNTTILLDDDWQDIIIYATAQRIAVIKRWNEQAKMLHDLLYGDPEFMQSQGKMGRPGLLSARLLQVERDEKFNTRRLGIVQSRYSR